MNTELCRTIKSARMLVAACTFSIASILAVTGADAIDIGGSLGSGGNNAGVGGSIGGGGGVSAGGSAQSQTGTTSNSSFGIGRSRSNGNFNLRSGDTSVGLNFGNGSIPGAGSSPGSIADSIRDLTPQEQRRLFKKCVAVLAAPQRYNSDTVAVCRVLASL